MDPQRGLSKVRFGEAALFAQSGPHISVGDSCYLCIRPHDLVADDGTAKGNVVVGIVESVLWQGDTHSITIEAGGVHVRFASPPFLEPPQLGSLLRARFDPGDAVLIADSPARG